ncbi:GNAT family N-acetyltransferase [Kitasatospora sp. RG8]|uniref:GNAT family N-acetyltransferase n=1 Tax=Kitasatospora sp. RG8 TaxID=2820815 RepID=UPI001ADF79CC|nr:GNAT family N-acetyltransferase [Kitasatospora sp. RG8]MBP0454576.1 GNAT family N-acetyltransferase [Kitasatospora sp. RG8]
MPQQPVLTADSAADSATDSATGSATDGAEDGTPDSASTSAEDGSAPPHPLDNPVRAALLGPHAHFAERRGDVLRYPADVSPFVALPDRPDREAWRNVAALCGPGTVLGATGSLSALPADWEVLMQAPGVQLVDDGVQAAPDEEAVRLGPADVPEMLALVEHARPGPFLPRTVELGGYLGIRRGGVLVAMAGERLRPPGWTEISAVCTAESHRGQGLGSRLVLAVAAGIRERGDTPFLHTSAGNATAIRLYESLGFRLRRKVTFLGLRVPGGGRGA